MNCKHILNQGGLNMNINNVTGYSDTTISTLANNLNSKDAETTTNSNLEDGVIYEKTSDTSSKKTTYTPNQSVIDQLKADAESRTSQLKSLVEQLFTKQGKTYDAANIWNLIRQGDYTVDAETAAKAKEDISEDGYWGVKQTSERIFSFAKALTGGDPSKIETMRDAVKEGFEAAAKMWGGDLPEISSQTYDAVMKSFDEWAKEASAEE